MQCFSAALPTKRRSARKRARPPADVIPSVQCSISFPFPTSPHKRAALAAQSIPASDLDGCPYKFRYPVEACASGVTLVTFHTPLYLQYRRPGRLGIVSLSASYSSHHQPDFSSKIKFKTTSNSNTCAASSLWHRTPTGLYE